MTAGGAWISAGPYHLDPDFYFAEHAMQYSNW